MEKHKCLIIGSGPAGFTAAIYASRANMSPVLYQGMQPGGQLTTTTDVDNFPGYPKGVNGTQMMIELEEQAKRFGTDVRMGMITKVDFSGPVHKVWVDNDKEIHADTIIISTGASARYLGLESEEKYLERTSRWQELCEKAHNTAEIIIAKQRHGPIGTIKTYFESNYTKFSDLNKKDYATIIE